MSGLACGGGGLGHSLASIAAYHGAQATWPPLLTPSSSSSSIPQLPPPKLNNAHQNIAQAARIWCRMIGNVYLLGKWTLVILQYSMLPIFGGYCVHCGREAGAHGSIIQHTAFCTHQHNPSWYQWKRKRSHTIQSFKVLWCSLLSFVDYLKERLDDTAEVGYLLTRT